MTWQRREIIVHFTQTPPPPPSQRSISDQCQTHACCVSHCVSCFKYAAVSSACLCSQLTRIELLRSVATRHQTRRAESLTWLWHWRSNVHRIPATAESSQARGSRNAAEVLSHACAPSPIRAESANEDRWRGFSSKPKCLSENKELGHFRFHSLKYWFRKQRKLGKTT